MRCSWCGADLIQFRDGIAESHKVVDTPTPACAGGRISQGCVMLRTEQAMSLDDEARVWAALGNLAAPLEEGQTVELAGITFQVVRP